MKKTMGFIMGATMACGVTYIMMNKKLRKKAQDLFEEMMMEVDNNSNN